MCEVINEVKGGCDGIRWMVERKLIRVALLNMATAAGTPHISGRLRRFQQWALFSLVRLGPQPLTFLHIRSITGRKSRLRFPLVSIFLTSKRKLFWQTDIFSGTSFPTREKNLCCTLYRPAVVISGTWSS